MYNIAVVGASGLVGQTVLKVLAERNIPIKNLFLFASSRSKGNKVLFRGKEYVIEELTEDSFTNRGIQIALFSAGGETSGKFSPIAAKNGVIVIDNSSFFRMHDDVPLIVPEINGKDVLLNKGIIANPNCSTIQSVIPLKILKDKYKIKRVIYNSYQAVSGAGVQGINDLVENKKEKFPFLIKDNCIPQIDVFLENGYTKEEEKMVNETRKILHEPSMNVTATCVRVPILNTHSVSINVEFEDDINIEDIKELFRKNDDIIFYDKDYPVSELANNQDKVLVGRVRQDFSVKNGINLWCVADNIRKGAATNAVQIAEKLIEYKLV